MERVKLLVMGNLIQITQVRSEENKMLRKEI
jgi:hypothetical protein